MATKDWRRQTQHNKIVTIYEHRFQSHKKVFISKTINGLWAMGVYKKQTKLVGKIFQTRPEAMKYAQAYMRKN